jgi:hypothetical protein
MMRRHWFVAASLVLSLTYEAPAQVVFAPPPVLVSGPVLVIQGGIGCYRRNALVPGFYTAGYPLWVPAASVYGNAYGGFDSRITIRVISPTVVVRQPVFPAQEVDFRGVDLDVVGPEALRPGANTARILLPPPGDKKPAEMPEPRKIEPAKPPAAEPPKKEVPAPPKPAPPPKADRPPGLGEPKAEPLEESRRLTELGIDAFRAREYNLAARRFDQAAEVAPAQSYPYFLLAQAYMALGKYQQAVAAIENGMSRRQDWPLSRFQPRALLYQGTEPDWFAHKKQLADAQSRAPNQPVYLFLQAYQWWFDGQRDEATWMFERARVLAPDNPFIAEFLKVVQKVAKVGL